MTRPSTPRDTAVVIVNYRTKELTCDAVASVLPEADVREVVVVDNGSGDGSADHLRRTFPDERVRVVESPRNGGFGAGVNLGVAESRSPLLLILNSDAAVRGGSIALLVTALLADDSLGVVAPTVLQADGEAEQPDAYGRLPRRWELLLSGAWSTNRSGHAAPVEWVSGVAMLLRSADFRSLEGFDEDFKMYFEDVDLCRRIRARGQSVRRLAEAGVVHGGGRSWPSGREQRRRYHLSRVVYARKLGATAVELWLICVTGRLRTSLPSRG